MMNRRSMLLGLGAALASPAIVRAESLMNIVAPKMIMPELRPLVTLDDYATRILWPAMVHLRKAMDDACIFGSGYLKFDDEKVRHIPIDMIPVDIGEALALDIYRMKEA